MRHLTAFLLYSTDSDLLTALLLKCYCPFIHIIAQKDFRAFKYLLRNMLFFVSGFFLCTYNIDQSVIEYTILIFILAEMRAKYYCKIFLTLR